MLAQHQTRESTSYSAPVLFALAVQRELLGLPVMIDGLLPLRSW